MEPRIISPHAPCVCARPFSARVRLSVSVVMRLLRSVRLRICSPSVARSLALSVCAVCKPCWNSTSLLRIGSRIASTCSRFCRPKISVLRAITSSASSLNSPLICSRASASRAIFSSAARRSCSMVSAAVASCVARSAAVARAAAASAPAAARRWRNSVSATTRPRIASVLAACARSAADFSSRSSPIVRSRACNAPSSSGTSVHRCSAAASRRSRSSRSPSAGEGATRRSSSATSRAARMATAAASAITVAGWIIGGSGAVWPGAIRTLYAVSASPARRAGQRATSARQANVLKFDKIESKRGCLDRQASNPWWR